MTDHPTTLYPPPLRCQYRAGSHQCEEYALPAREVCERHRSVQMMRTPLSQLLGAS